MENGSDSNALAVIQQIPTTESAVAHWRRTTDVAGLVRTVVLNCTVSIQGRKYLTVAGYQAVANAFGCVASARDVLRVEGGWQATGEVRRMSDGMVLSTGVGFLGDDEAMWKTRPQFSKMAMAQTRACGRALRAAFAFMAPVIDGNLQTTPAEEMELVEGSTTPPAPTGTAGLKERLRAPPASPPRAPAPHNPTTGEVVASHDRTASFGFGKGKGVPLAELEESALKWYGDCLNRDLADESKSQWHTKTRAQLANLVAEMKMRGM